MLDPFLPFFFVEKSIVKFLSGLRRCTLKVVKSTDLELIEAQTQYLKLAVVLKDAIQQALSSEGDQKIERVMLLFAQLKRLPDDVGERWKDNEGEQLPKYQDWMQQVSALFSILLCRLLKTHGKTALQVYE